MNKPFEGPPHFHEDEKVAVSTMLQDSDLAHRVLAELTPSAFHDQSLRQVFIAIRSVMQNENTQFSSRDVIAELERCGAPGPTSLIADLLDCAVPSMLTPTCLARLREAEARREAIIGLESLREECFDTGKDLGHIQAGLEEVVGAFRAVDTSDPLRLTPWASDLPNEQIPPHIIQNLFVVGEPRKSGGTLGLVSGDRGLGKSWWILGAAYGITNELPLGKLLTRSCPVAVLLLESERWESIARRDAINSDPQSWKKVMVWDKRDLLSDAAHPFSLLDPIWQERLTRNIRERGIRLLIIDPLGKALRGEASLLDDRDAIRACTTLEAIAFDTGCAVLLIAHKPKQQGLGPARRTAFGSYIWESTPRTVGSFDENRGAICLSWQKSHAGPLPPPTWYKVGTWPLEVMEEPTDSRHARDGRLEFLLGLQKDGVSRTPKEMAEALEAAGFKPVKPDTIRRRYIPILEQQGTRKSDTESRPESVRNSSQLRANQ